LLTAGTHTLTVTFDPTDSTDYYAGTATVSQVVTQATPTITWATPAAIVYGAALNGNQLDAKASVAGSLTYTPALGAVLAAGKQTLSVAFKPTDTTDYKTATASVVLTVGQATPKLTWAAPAAITYGTALSSTQLDATASVAGSFKYTPASGTVLAAGPQTLKVAFTPTNATDYTTASASVTLTVNKATPTIAWATPAAVALGTKLSSTQLDATVTFKGVAVPGVYTYTPAAGTVLSTAGKQTLSVSFVPTNSTDFVSPIKTTTTITVN
jgi:hypothetical protein